MWVITPLPWKPIDRPAPESPMFYTPAQYPPNSAGHRTLRTPSALYIDSPMSTPEEPTFWNVVVPSGGRLLAMVVTEMGILQAEKAEAEKNVAELDAQIMSLLTMKKEIVDEVIEFNLKEKSLYAELCQHAGLTTSLPVLPKEHPNPGPVSPRSRVYHDRAPSISTSITVTTGRKRDQPDNAMTVISGSKSAMDRKKVKSKYGNRNLRMVWLSMPVANYFKAKRLSQQLKHSTTTKVVKRSKIPIPVRLGAISESTSQTV